jgi:hypothetical protein
MTISWADVERRVEDRVDEPVVDGLVEGKHALWPYLNRAEQPHGKRLSRITTSPAATRNSARDAMTIIALWKSTDPKV